MSGDSSTLIAFQLRAETVPGQNIRVVGSTPELGSWDPKKALPLDTQAKDYPKWSGSVRISADTLQAASLVEYKFVKVDGRDNAQWEDGPNRDFKIDDSETLSSSGGREPYTPRFGKAGGACPRLVQGQAKVMPAEVAPQKKTLAQPQVSPPAPLAPPAPPAATAPPAVSATPQQEAPTPVAHQDAEEVHFEVVCKSTGLGDVLCVVGSCSSLGDWNVKKGLELSTGPTMFPRWSATAQIGRDPVEWKLCIQRAKGGEDWERCSNRRISLPAGKGPWKVRCDFDSSCSSVEAVRPPAASNQSSHGHKHLERAQSEYGPPALVPMRRQSVASAAPSFISVAKKTPSPRPSPAIGPSDPPRRSTSLSLLGDSSPLLAGHWGRRKDDLGSAAEEQVLLLKLGLASAERADLLTVEVAFKADTSVPKRVMKRTGWESEDSQAVWSLPVGTIGLAPGVHFFHFLVNGEYLLSQEHLIMGGWNAVMYSEPFRRYILARDANGQPSGEDTASADKAGLRGRLMSEMAGHSMVGAGASAVSDDSIKEPGQRHGGLARPYSICGNLVGLADDTDEEEPTKEDNSRSLGVALFAKEVFEGLFDGELRLRTDGFVLPDENPDPPVASQPLRQQALRLWAGAHLLKKAQGTCEDAYFVDPHGLGVADGVGCMVQFASYGINAAAYAAELMEQACAALKPDGCASEDRPSSVDERAAAALSNAESRAQAYGASTVTVLCQQGNKLGAANLGDSGFMVLRRGPRGMIAVHRSEEQQHSWNCPYQLTRLPPALLNRFPKLQLDRASDCERYTTDIREGDLILVFSDGLRDNLHDREVLHIVDRALSPAFGDLVGLLDRCTPPENVARALAMAAHERSLDPTAKVPFVEYSKRHGFECLGGKQDDITVVAAWVVPDESQETLSVPGLDLEAICRKEEKARQAQAEETARQAAKAALSKEDAASSASVEADSFPAAESSPSRNGLNPKEVRRNGRNVKAAEQDSLPAGAEQAGRFAQGPSGRLHSTRPLQPAFERRRSQDLTANGAAASHVTSPRDKLRSAQYRVDVRPLSREKA